MNSDLATTRCMPAMTNLRITKIQARQRGVALLLMLLVVLMIGGTFGVRALNLSTFSGGIENRETSKILAQSKEALLAWSQAVDPTSSGGHRAIRPGALPYPDVYGTGISVGPIAYDGMQDLGCIPRTWTVALSQNLVAPSTTPPIPTNLRCIGKLPWRLLGLDLNQDGTPDSAGFVPWYAVSANLIDHSYASECPARFGRLHRTIDYSHSKLRNSNWRSPTSVSLAAGTRSIRHDSFKSGGGSSDSAWPACHQADRHADPSKPKLPKRGTRPISGYRAQYPMHWRLL